MLICDPLKFRKLSLDHPELVALLHAEYVKRLADLHATNAKVYGTEDEQKIVIVSKQEAEDLEGLK